MPMGLVESLVVGLCAFSCAGHVSWFLSPDVSSFLPSVAFGTQLYHKLPSLELIAFSIAGSPLLHCFEILFCSFDLYVINMHKNLVVLYDMGLVPSGYCLVICLSNCI
jgi:hypothetical protein